MDEYNILAANHAGTYRAEDKQPEAVQAGSELSIAELPGVDGVDDLQNGRVSVPKALRSHCRGLAALVLLLALCIPKLW